MNLRFLYFIYTLTYRTCRKFIMYQQLLLFVTWVSSLPFQFILHSLTVWWITTTVSMCNCISLVHQTLINFQTFTIFLLQWTGLLIMPLGMGKLGASLLKRISPYGPPLIRSEKWDGHTQNRWLAHVSYVVCWAKCVHFKFFCEVMEERKREKKSHQKHCKKILCQHYAKPQKDFEQIQSWKEIRRETRGGDNDDNDDRAHKNLCFPEMRYTLHYIVM